LKLYIDTCKARVQMIYFLRPRPRTIKYFRHFSNSQISQFQTWTFRSLVRKRKNLQESTPHTLLRSSLEFPQCSTVSIDLFVFFCTDHEQQDDDTWPRKPISEINTGCPSSCIPVVIWVEALAMSLVLDPRFRQASR
jgi:hypothetical protein